MRLRLLAALAAFCFSGMTAAASDEAFFIDPMELHLAPSPGNSAKLRIVNKDDHSNRIRVDVFERSDTVDGSEQRVLSEDVRVSATEFTILAGGTKNLVVTYRGARKIPRERAFRIVVKQVNQLNLESSLDVGKPQPTPTSLDLRFVYVASVYVAPEKAESRLIVKEVRRLAENQIEVDLHNEGHVHQMLTDLQAFASTDTPSKQTPLELTTETRRMLSRQNLLAGSRRRLVLQIVPNERLTSGTPVVVKLVKSNTTGRAD